MTAGRDVTGFEASAAIAAGMISSSRSVLVVGHIDADGITASSIASAALTRAGIPHDVRSVKKLDEAEVTKAAAHPAEKIWLVDLGSGAPSALSSERFVITDHHKVDPAAEGRRNGHVNPHLHGLDGSSEISGAGVTYVVAKSMDPRNADLSALAVVGAVGDFQEAAEGRLTGYNRVILGDAVSLGLISAEKDLRLFGRQTRPLHALLQYSSEPSLMPYLVKGRTRHDDLLVEPEEDEDQKLAVIDFLEGLGIVLGTEDTFRTWSQLSFEEKRTIVSALVGRIADSGKGLPVVRRLIGETYTLSPSLPGAPAGWLSDPAEGAPKASNGCAWRPSARALLDAKEFSTLLNACGRHDRADVGISICLGDRKGSLDVALAHQDDHRRKLREAMDLVKGSPDHMARTATPGGRELNAVRYFHGGAEIEDTIVGIVAGMLLSGPDFPADRPLIAFAQAGDGSCTVKVSGRGTRELTRRGLDLSAAMRSASEKVGGSGGGHNIAAGATVPEGREEEFLLEIDRTIRSQISPSA
jgi:single-stranded-DNA-specific exonuclease